ncbi:MAG: DUF72 domain-containing protein [Anaerolineaceae bacterium]|nr:DUF72 domain-containing protein [Anaerolineaceae bacterium]
MGTSGFSYRDWRGTVYPPGLPAAQWLGYYANLLPTLELNVTFYRIPALKTLRNWIGQTPDGFLFSVKMLRSLTHARDGQHLPAFLQAIDPLRQEHRLAAVLAQFPPSFRPDPANQDYLRRLVEEMGDCPLVVEMRHPQWLAEKGLAMLAGLLVSLGYADDARWKSRMAGLDFPARPVGYVRFHGRNPRVRYDYAYSGAELKEWLPRLTRLDRDCARTLVYFNNCYRGQALESIAILANLLTI